jgi:dienelactone hydrolase
MHFQPGFKTASILLTLALGISAAFGQTETGSPGRETGRQSILIPSPDPAVQMRTELFRPPGDGPFPLVVINHGTTGNALQRARLPQPVYLDLARYFVGRGYAVAVPQRPGHGATGGPYLESNGNGCQNADYFASGHRTADIIATAIAFMIRQPFVKPTGVIVVGQSAGGWGALALASRNPPEVRAVINFAGGRGGRVNNQPNVNCAPERLVTAAGRFGATSRIPSLWLYTENDSYFGPDLSRRLAAAFKDAGGAVDFRLLPAFADDGHRLSHQKGGIEVWRPLVEQFLSEERARATQTRDRRRNDKRN